MREIETMLKKHKSKFFIEETYLNYGTPNQCVINKFHIIFFLEIQI